MRTPSVLDVLRIRETFPAMEMRLLRALYSTEVQVNGRTMD